MNLSRIRKLIGTALGGITGVGVATVLALAGLNLPDTVDAALAVILAAIGTYIAPPNTTPEE